MSSADVQAGLEFILGHIIQDFMHFLHGAGLSALQIHALLYIYHTGECQLSEIAQLTHSSKAATSQLVDRLVQQELVERREDPVDRRNKRVRLTRKSLGMIRKGITFNRSLNDLMGSLTPEQREKVHDALGILAQAGEPIRDTARGKEKKHAQDS